MVCPYSLSIPGGVQAQVMGLSRELRKMGIEVRVLAPCDGPPPATFVTPLGNSLPTSANGSMAPLAPDPSCSLRTMRALGDEQFDVLHLHEPFIPGPTQTAMLLHPAPVIATFHAAGDSPSYKYLKVSIKPAAANIAHAVAVSKDAAELVRRYIGGDYEILYNGVELDAYRSSPAHPTTGPTIFFCGRHEERKGLDVLLAAVQELGPEVRVWVGSTGPDSARLQVQYASDSRIEWLGRLTDADKMARLRGADVFCAPSLHGESFGVVLIEAMAAETPSSPAGSTVTATWRRTESTPSWSSRATSTRWPSALKRALYEPGLSESLRRAGSQRSKDFSMTALARRYAEHYMRLATNRPRRDGPPTRESFLRGWRRRMMAD